MPKNKKVAPFMIFVKERYPNLNLQVAISKASKEWEDMSDEKKGKYRQKANKPESLNLPPRERLTTHGIPMSYIEKQNQELKEKEWEMKTKIEDIVYSARENGNLADIKFNFMCVNYFSNLSDSVYSPAEIALAVYTLRDGILNKYHSLVNPVEIPYGDAFKTKQHSEETHQLGVPPNVEGEKNLGKLYVDCMDFILENNEAKSKPPPIFTRKENVKVVESALKFLLAGSFESYSNDDSLDIRVYPLHYLFYILKKTTSEMGETKSPDSIHITNAYLDKDLYEYETDIACETHEKKDRGKYCALSCVTRWAYTFSDHLCKDLALKMEPGCHVPRNADLAIGTTYNLSEFDSIVTQPKAENTFSNFNDSSFDSLDKFPTLSDSRNKKKKNSDDRNIAEITNPWSRSDRFKNPRSPADESFSIDESFQKPSGRGSILNKANEKLRISKGRGLILGD